ncbi:MAG: hypothetical protein J2P48_09935 [Alphaproteobacteria bacterium]|nr:hypothetical protein [Alphaproteobacteria bacterium]
MGLVRLALIDLGRAWPRPGLAVLAIAPAVLAVAFFATQIELRRGEVLAAYEAVGAATFVFQLTGIPDDEIDSLAGSTRGLGAVNSAEAPYSGIGGEIVADTSFLVFRNEQQQEYLGARTNVLGVDPNFDLARDYYVNFHDANPKAPETVLGMPLLTTGGVARAPGPHEVRIPSGVADYVGVQPGTDAIVELVYTGGKEPIVQRFDGLRLSGTFDLVGPDQGRFNPFWRFNSRGQDVLTVRSEDTGTGPTALPIVLNVEVFRGFLSSIRTELARQGVAPARLPGRHQLVVRANSLADVPVAEAAAERLLLQRGLEQACDGQSTRSFCLRLPEKNNFRVALNEQKKIGTGGAFFIALLLTLVAIGTAGLQVQTVITRWRDYGVLQALGFAPAQILAYYGLQLVLVLIGGVAIAALVAVLLPAWSTTSLITAAGLATTAAGLAALPVLLWPLWRLPAELLRDTA